MVAQPREARVILPVEADKDQLYATIGNESLQVGEIHAKTGFPIEQAPSSLASMQLKGRLHQVGGMHSVAVRETQADY